MSMLATYGARGAVFHAGASVVSNNRAAGQVIPFRSRCLDASATLMGDLNENSPRLSGGWTGRVDGASVSARSYRVRTNEGT